MGSEKRSDDGRTAWAVRVGGGGYLRALPTEGRRTQIAFQLSKAAFFQTEAQAETAAVKLFQRPNFSTALIRPVKIRDEEEVSSSAHVAAIRKSDALKLRARRRA